jgi:hypothetical protein
MRLGGPSPWFLTVGGGGTTQVDAATAKGIPVSTITDAMTPAAAGGEDWWPAQLTALEAALAQAAT